MVPDVGDVDDRRMRTNTITRTVAGGALLLMAAAGLACSKSASASESPYCNTAREWSVHELTPRDDGDPAVFKKYWQDYLAFMDKGLATAPAAIHDDWVTYHKAVEPQTAVLAKYGYDRGRFDSEATDADKAVMEPQDPKSQDAFHAVLRYEALTCDAAQPLAADVSFEGEKPGPYCEAVAKDNENVQELRESGFDPDLVRAMLSVPAKRKLSDDMVALLVSTAPKTIKDDVKANVRWWEAKQRPVLAKYGYDMKKVLLEGSARDRQALQLTGKSIRDHYARTVAYEEQVCAAEEG
jgi:hypothetical protein